MSEVPNPPALPDVLPGHWDTPGGCEMATEYAAKSRADLMMSDLSDLQLANAQYLVGRESFELIHYQTAAKERIRWLSAQLAMANAMLTARTQTGASQ